MPLTQAKAIEAFEHILSYVFKVPKDRLAIAGYEDIWGLFTLSDADIESLTYDWIDMEKDIPLGRHQSLLHIFCHYCDHQNYMGAPIGDDWFAVSADDFNAYCTSSDYRPPSTGAVISPPTASAFQSTIYSPPKVENSKHGMKQDPSLSMTSKDGKNHSPPTLYCKWAEDVFCHIVTVVFQKTMDSPLVETLEGEGITDVFSMVTMCDQDIADIPLHISDKQLRFISRNFHFPQLCNGHSAHDLISVTHDEFDDFK